MFKFNFDTAQDDRQSSQEAAAEPESDSTCNSPAEEVFIKQASAQHHFRLLTIDHRLSLLKCVVEEDAADKLVQDVTCSGSDLVPGKYEGGFKLWEGAMDLARFMVTAEARLDGDHWDSKAALQGWRVLELGCGHGVPGLAALSQGAHVDFQDYNVEVLKELLLPNVMANWSAWQTRGERSAGDDPPCRCFSGSWTALEALLNQEGLAGQYDVVLTSETIYSLDSVPSLLACIQTVRRALKPGGRALVAAKTYYFGVGGSTAAFKQQVQALGSFDMQTFAVEGKDVSLQREIIMLQKIVD